MHTKTGADNQPLIDFFLWLNFAVGLKPVPLYGIERNAAGMRVTVHIVEMARAKTLPDFRKHIWIRSLPEYTSSMFDGVSTRDIEYSLALADVYLDWLYDQNAKAC